MKARSTCRDSGGTNCIEVQGSPSIRAWGTCQDSSRVTPIQVTSCGWVEPPCLSRRRFLHWSPSIRARNTCRSCGWVDPPCLSRRRWSPSIRARSTCQDSGGTNFIIFIQETKYREPEVCAEESGASLGGSVSGHEAPAEAPETALSSNARGTGDSADASIRARGTCQGSRFVTPIQCWHWSPSIRARSTCQDSGGTNFIIFIQETKYREPEVCAEESGASLGGSVSGHEAPAEARETALSSKARGTGDSADGIPQYQGPRHLPGLPLCHPDPMLTLEPQYQGSKHLPGLRRYQDHHLHPRNQVQRAWGLRWGEWCLFGRLSIRAWSTCRGPRDSTSIRSTRYRRLCWRTEYQGSRHLPGSRFVTPIQGMLTLEPQYQGSKPWQDSGGTNFIIFIQETQVQGAWGLRWGEWCLFGRLSIRAWSTCRGPRDKPARAPALSPRSKGCWRWSPSIRA